jgi:hypothetical protein
MTALESIKEIEDFGNIDLEEKEFLLKAFKVMREIAHTVMDNLVEGDNLRFDDVDKEFEERMKDVESK